LGDGFPELDLGGPPGGSPGPTRHRDPIYCKKLTKRPWGGPGGAPGGPRGGLCGAQGASGGLRGPLPGGYPPGGPPRASFGTPAPHWGRSPERRRGAMCMCMTKRKTETNTERHGAIDRKRGVKTPTKA
jgi:hypothetical protein